MKSRGIDDFKVAMKFVEGMKETTGVKEYSLNDFIIYTCLLDEVVFDDYPHIVIIISSLY